MIIIMLREVCSTFQWERGELQTYTFHDTSYPNKTQEWLQMTGADDEETEWKPAAKRTVDAEQSSEHGSTC